ncbi:hypothetical protein BH10ACT10_BH10ACT10_06240 [soil metagenome]
MHIERIDPLDLDLDTADALAEVATASEAGDGLDFPPKTGPDVLTSRQLGFDSRPLDALFVAFDGDRVVGEADVELPWRDNLDQVGVRGRVHPDARRHGIGRDLWERSVAFARENGRTRLSTGAWLCTGWCDFLTGWGLSRTGTGVIRRIDVHATPASAWDRLYDEGLAHAGDYEITRQVGGTPADQVEAMVALHTAINDAPSTDPDD